MRFLVRLFAVMLAFPPLASLAQPDASTLRTWTESAAGRLFDTQGMLIEQPLVQRARNYFELQEELTAAFLKAHPDSTTKDLQTYLSAIRKGMAADAVSLNSTDILVGTTEYGVGNLFVVRKDAKQAQIVWRARNQRGQQTGWKSLTDPRCSSGVFREKCIPLSEDRITAIGPARVVVEGTYLQYAGGTLGKRIVVWRWTGSAMLQQFAGDFQVFIDQPEGTRISNSEIKIRMKDFWKHFDTCGGCAGRQREWTLKITSFGIIDKGKHSVVPELDFIDTKAATVLRDLDLGMIEAWTVNHDGSRSDVCVEFDTASFQIVLSELNGSYSVLHHRRLPEGQTCPAEMKGGAISLQRASAPSQP